MMPQMLIKKTIYGKLISDLNKLNSEGIEICVNGRRFKVYFKVVLVLGDNLALNDMLGFVKGFSAKYFCRFCKASSDLTSRMCIEDSNLLRTTINYAADIEINNVKTTGVKKSCVFNDLDDFSVIKNYSVDIVHDLLQGACRYEVMYALSQFIFKKIYFSLNVLNWRVK